MHLMQYCTYSSTCTCTCRSVGLQLGSHPRATGLPVYALPKVDIAKGNGIKQVFLAEYENGFQLTIVFEDEDRPSAVTDAMVTASS